MSRQSLMNTTSAEWVKFTTLRSTLWVLLITGVLFVGFAALVTAAISATWETVPEEIRSTFDATSSSLSGVAFAQISIGVLGILMVTSEYATGLISNTFAATPRRSRNFLAKALVFAPVVFVVAAIFAFVSFFLGQAIFSTKDIDVSIGDPGVIRAVLAAPVFLVMVGLMGIALGLLLRSTAASITVLTLTVFVLPILSAVFPASWRESFFKFLPSNAGSAMMSVEKSPELLAPLAGFGVLTLYLVALFGLALFKVSRSDA